MKPSCALLVLNYDGRHLLQRYLPSAIVAARAAGACVARVIVVDNRSSDGSVAWVEAELPQVTVLSAPANRYLYSLNWAAGQVDADLLLLLNNDVQVPAGAVDPLVEALSTHPHAFSVTPRMVRADRSTPDSGRWLGCVRQGLVELALDGSAGRLAPTLFSSGGAMLVRRQSFLALGGFDAMYYPIYWEDVDLCYRAWKRGLPSLYQPASAMVHLGSATLGADAGFVAAKPALYLRNAWCFAWRNLAERRVLAANLYWTARHYAWSLRRGRRELARAYRQAVARWPRALWARLADEPHRVLSDRQILGWVQDGEAAPC